MIDVFKKIPIPSYGDMFTEKERARINAIFTSLVESINENHDVNIDIDDFVLSIKSGKITKSENYRRMSVTLPSLVLRKYRYVAIDSNGGIFAYTRKPRIYAPGSSWEGSDTMEFIGWLSVDGVRVTKYENWHRSLVRIEGKDASKSRSSKAVGKNESPLFLPNLFRAFAEENGYRYMAMCRDGTVILYAAKPSYIDRLEEWRVGSGNLVAALNVKLLEPINSSFKIGGDCKIMYDYQTDKFITSE